MYILILWFASNSQNLYRIFLEQSSYHGVRGEDDRDWLMVDCTAQSMPKFQVMLA